MVRSSMFGHCCLIEFLFLNFDQKEIRTHGRFVYVMILSLLSDLLIAESQKISLVHTKREWKAGKKGMIILVLLLVLLYKWQMKNPETVNCIILSDICTIVTLWNVQQQSLWVGHFWGVLEGSFWNDVKHGRTTSLPRWR